MHSHGNYRSGTAEQFFSGKNPAVFASQNPRILPMASAKNSQKYPPASSHSVHIFKLNLNIYTNSSTLIDSFPVKMRIIYTCLYKSAFFWWNKIKSHAYMGRVEKS